MEGFVVLFIGILVAGWGVLCWVASQEHERERCLDWIRAHNRGQIEMLPMLGAIRNGDEAPEWDATEEAKFLHELRK